MVWLCLIAGHAQAFSDYFRYAEATSEGGTDGRYFTGSPMDGYGCNACHQGGEGAPVSVSGLPDGSYQPGAAYEVTIRFDGAEPHAAMVLEFVDETARPAGTISPPSFPDDIDLLPTDEFCMEEGMITGPALNPIESDEGRNLIAVPDCGARAVRFIWTAPSADVGTVWMAGGVVHSDKGADPIGDGVTLLRTPLLTGAGEAYARQVASGCAVASAPAQSRNSGLGALGVWLFILSTFGIRYRRRTTSCSVGHNNEE